MAAPSRSSITTRIWHRLALARPVVFAIEFIDRQRGAIVLFATTYLIVLLLGIGVGVSWAREDAVPSVRVLGSGSRLSLLVTSAYARLLIATGDDATVFSNAFGEAVNPSTRRIDLLLVAGDERDLPVAARALRDFGERQVFVVDGPLRGHLSDLELAPDQVIAKPVSIELPGGVEVVISPGATRDGSWQASIRWRDLEIRVGSTVGAVDQTGHAEAVILTSRTTAPELAGITSPALVMPTGSADLSELRDAFESGDSDRWALRVASGSSAQLTFADDGLHLPATAQRVAGRRASNERESSRLPPTAVWQAMSRTRL